MSFNPLKEKGIPLEKQIKTYDDIVHRPYKREIVDCYTRTRQILMNGIEVESWGFKHHIVRTSDCMETKRLVSDIRRIEDMQQTTINWLCPHNQSVLDTTLGYEQVAIDLTSWLAQNEPDEYVRETYDFGLLEDFDHLYRYSQFAYLIEGTDSNDILHYNTDVMFARPTQYHHNPNRIRIRKSYDKSKVSFQTKANILTLMSAEQQTHNFYAEHGFMYGSDDLRRLYAEISDVEEEHVTMYETLIDPNETMYEKLLLHEFMEVCCYHNCYKDEIDSKIKLIWEEFLAMEIEHLKLAANLLKEKENKDPEEIIGDKVYDTCHFESQQEYVQNVIENEIDKRLDAKSDMGYSTIDELQEDWEGYDVQKVLLKSKIPSETAVNLVIVSQNTDIISCDDGLYKKRDKLIDKALDNNAVSKNTLRGAEYKKLDKKNVFE